MDQDALVILDFDALLFGFREWFCEVLQVTDLERLHAIRNVSTSNYRDHVSAFQRECDTAAPTIQDRLNRFFASIVVPRYGPIANRQPAPTFRSHFAVSDSDLLEESRDFGLLEPSTFLKRHYFDNYRPGVFHRDKDYGLINGTVNLWLPVTDVYGTNTLWIGDRNRGGRDAMPIHLHYGQCLFFDGAHRWHGAVWNCSPTTRISFDIRFIPSKHLPGTPVASNDRDGGVT